MNLELSGHLSAEDVEELTSLFFRNQHLKPFSDLLRPVLHQNMACHHTNALSIIDLQLKALREPSIDVPTPEVVTAMARTRLCREIRLAAVRVVILPSLQSVHTSAS